MVGPGIGTDMEASTHNPVLPDAEGGEVSTLIVPDDPSLSTATPPEQSREGTDPTPRDEGKDDGK